MCDDEKLGEQLFKAARAQVHLGQASQKIAVLGRDLRDTMEKAQSYDSVIKPEPGEALKHLRAATNVIDSVAGAYERACVMILAALDQYRAERKDVEDI